MAKPLRIIFSLYFTFANRTALVVQLNRQGLPECGGEWGYVYRQRPLAW
jgi:hypothetical protein